MAELRVACQWASDKDSIWLRVAPYPENKLICCAFQFFVAGKDPESDKNVYALRSVMHTTDPMIVADAVVAALRKKNVGVLVFPPFLVSDAFVKAMGGEAFTRDSDMAEEGIKPLFMRVPDA